MSKQLLGDFFPDDSGNDESFKKLWDSTEAAGDLKPLPKDKYCCLLVSGEQQISRKGTRGYKITFRVIDGEFSGRLVWDDVWFTNAALPMAKRKLARLGITTSEQVYQPVPPGIRCTVHVVVSQKDDGRVDNDVTNFEVTGHDEPEVNPFAPEQEV